MKILRFLKLMKVVKFQRYFRILKNLRKIKTINAIYIILSSVTRVSLLISQILQCGKIGIFFFNYYLKKILIVIKILPILFIMFFIYAIIGVELLKMNNNLPNKNEKTIFLDYEFKRLFNFTTLSKALLTLFQIMTEVNWNLILFEFAVNSDNYFLISIYFISFHILIVTLILNLLKGNI